MAARGRRAGSKQVIAPRLSPAPEPRGLPPARALSLPFGFTALLFALTVVPAIRQTPGLLHAFVGAGLCLLAWAGLLLVSARSRGRTLRIDIALHKQHYLQACAQFSVMMYWG